MTCLSFAKLLRARKFFWICDAMCVFFPDGLKWCAERKTKRSRNEESPAYQRSVFISDRGGYRIELTTYVRTDECAFSRRKPLLLTAKRKPGLRIAQPQSMEGKSTVQVDMPKRRWIAVGGHPVSDPLEVLPDTPRGPTVPVTDRCFYSLHEGAATWLIGASCPAA
jgi:hypothetical protein